ncbi:GNAT family N-acetyltransferase [Desulfovibrio inopinatus]|uniref:GNAT family N-acetyltransferase n=1 Tax=Desulfovibrio inopinatus TaxID=102109 RepID=UPI0004176FD4|nr:N-acetyltransferase [Desulfovibrio inopinatus]
MRIRQEEPSDIEAISQLHYAAFQGHPAHESGAEPCEHLIVILLRQAGELTISLVAEENDEIVGHIALSPAILGQTHNPWFLLGPIGVLPAHQRQGIGTALMQVALKQAQVQGVEGVVLVGDLGYYSRFGLRSYSGLTYPGVPDEFVLGLAFGAHPPRGEIQAHRAFKEAMNA